MPRSSFKGDQDGHVEQLIVASMNKQIHDHELRDRPLVPFFDGIGADTSFEPLQKRAHPHKSASQAISNGKHTASFDHHGLKRSVNDRSNAHLTDGSGSPPKKENQVVKAKHRRNKGGAGATTSNGMPATPGAPKHSKSAAKNAAALASDHTNGTHSDGELSAHTASKGAKQRDGGKPPRPAPSKSSAHLDVHSTSADGTPSKGNGFRTTKFAGPAFTNSPMPDSLPIPTTSLLLQEAAERMRSRLLL